MDARNETQEGVLRVNLIMLRHFLMNRMTLAAQSWSSAPFVVSGPLGKSGIRTTDDAGDAPALGGVT